MATKSSKSTRMSSTASTKADDINSSGTEGNGSVLERIEKKLNDLIGVVEAIRVSNLKIVGEVESLKRENRTLSERVEDLETQYRLDNLVISGLPVKDYAEAASASSTPSSTPGQGAPNPLEMGRVNTFSESTEQAVVDFCRTNLNVNMTNQDISMAYRITSKSSSGTPPIIVRFVSRKVRDAVYKARKVLFATKQKIYINEHLTKGRSEVFREARKLIRDKKLASAWSFNGSIFIRLSDLPTSRPIRVNQLTDLP